jgi:hypothetical protein
LSHIIQPTSALSTQQPHIPLAHFFVGSKYSKERMCRDLGKGIMQLVLLLLLSLTLSSRFTSAHNVEETTRSKPSAGLRGADNRKLNGDMSKSLLIRINQDVSSFIPENAYTGSSGFAGFTTTAPLVNLGSWILSLDAFDVGVVTQNNGLFLSQDENSLFRLEGGTQVCIRPRPQFDIDAQVSQLISTIGANVVFGNGFIKSAQKYCYVLREEDFLNRDGGTNEASVTFTFTPGGQAAVITSSAPLTPVASPSPPAESPTSGDALAGNVDASESTGDSEAEPDFREDDESNSPSVSPSTHPSYLPSDSPSAVPSQQPSETPSTSPSDIPSYLPSDFPSEVPSRQPSGTPSVSPSDIPSYLPSDSPSVVPSRRPSATPSALPSAFPTNMPSSAPTALPSGTPSVYPSILPSQVPTTTPSALPNFVPTTDIGFRDTESDSPSSYPTERPSGEPNGHPSSTPTMSPGPTFSPSPIPRFAVVRIIPDIPSSSTPADAAAITSALAMTQQQWLVTVDGVDAPRGMLTELVTDYVTAAVSSGSQVCIRPIDTGVSGVSGRIQDSPGGFGPNFLGSIDPFAIVYTKDLCYTLRDSNFRSFGGEMIAKIDFLL